MTCKGCELIKECRETGAELQTCKRYKPKTNFDRITDSPEALAEFIADAMFLYSTNKHIYTIEAVKMASKKEGIDIDIEFIYKDVLDWLNKESKGSKNVKNKNT